MMDKPDPTATLDAAHLAEMEDAYLEADWQRLNQINQIVAQGFSTTDELPPLPEVPALTLADAVEALRRIGYHNTQVSIVEWEAATLIAPLQQQIDQIKAWAAEQIEDRERRIAFHESRLVAYYRANPPTKSKTLKLPNGTVATKAQQPEWVYGDEGLVAALLVQHRLPFIRTKVEITKGDLKKSARVVDGRVYVPTNDGELLELPDVTVTERPDKFVVEVG